MAPSKTKTMKNKHAGGKGGQNKHQDRKPGPPDGIVRAKKTAGTPPSTKTIVQNKVARLLEKRKRDKNKKYTDEELGLPKLNMITPVGVEKPKGKKKGKIFVDDRESMSTILSIVQAEKEGQIESKMIKARQMEEIREARRLEEEKKVEERRAKLEDVKDGLRKKRKRSNKNTGADEDKVSELAAAGTRATKPKSKKRVSFAG
ncbi:60S ribosomal subunit assembly/export protein [Verticillium nonalfalfae]|uniref:60S ribosomal subunit assembly/export protein n=1 Tax=Verticillium nonalfalfae TaxID=1051616 RepID=A0A3M9Y902_9PEZI|nr:60S ribosomal subunit assembly/export protein [Verticillium nonalfalfae]RNJ55988.1 60S ribosomal subunit assembly/export protein [Verticillium nonalfalfae]